MLLLCPLCGDDADVESAPRGSEWLFVCRGVIHADPYPFGSGRDRPVRSVPARPKPGSTGLEVIRDEVARRGIQRLCHFTRSENLPQILDAGGVLSRRAMQRDLTASRPSPQVNDASRADGHLDHVSASIEVPNIWMLDKVRVDHPQTEWLILLIDPDPLWRSTTRFCRKNAASRGGTLVTDGPQGFLELFSEYEGTWGRRYERQPLACPTDGQAEVLVSQRVERGLIKGFAVPTRRQLDSELSRLAGRSDLGDLWAAVCPRLFDRPSVRAYLHDGIDLDLRPEPI